MSELAASKGERTRHKLVATAARLFERQGYHATGLAEILEESGAPRGSLYFHFPGGKDELACAALGQAGAAWRARIESVLARAPNLGVAVDEVCKLLADDLAASGYEHGCPVAAVALEAPATSDTIRQAVEAHYTEWRELIVDRLATTAVAREPARQLAVFALAAIEGALLLAKAQRSRDPLITVGAMLRAMANLQLGLAEVKPSASRGVRAGRSRARSARR
ncbi:MAG TPA: TetR/AcrR family transcriptional regulator [Kofleriaceae bacterium]|nr:TetR/AcrR family transcriptional regulator [Kofleriaceae bacterium]